MIPSVPIPNRGEVLRASWAQQIAGAVNSLSALANNGGAKWTNLRDRRGGDSAVVSPYQIAYSGDLSSYIIYLPKGEIFIYNGESVNLENELEPVEGYSDWYNLELEKDISNVFLKLSAVENTEDKESEESGPEAEDEALVIEFVSEKDVEDTSAFYVHLATISDSGKKIEQLVRSAIIYSAGGTSFSPDKTLNVNGEEVAKVGASDDIVLEMVGGLKAADPSVGVPMTDNHEVDGGETVLNGSVIIGARPNSGIVIHTFEDENGKYIGFDIVGHHSDEDEIHEDGIRGLGLYTIILEKDDKGLVTKGFRFFGHGDQDLSGFIPKLDKTFTVNNIEIAKIAASKNINFGQKNLVAGEGIKLELTEEGAIKISLDGEGASGEGFTGDIETIAQVDYDDGGAYLTRQKATLSFENGRLVEHTRGVNEVYHAATEES